MQHADYVLIKCAVGVFTDQVEVRPAGVAAEARRPHSRPGITGRRKGLVRRL